MAEPIAPTEDAASAMIRSARMAAVVSLETFKLRGRGPGPPHRLAGAHGTSGQEDRVREIVRAQLAPVVNRVEVLPARQPHRVARGRRPAGDAGRPHGRDRADGHPRGRPRLPARHPHRGVGRPDAGRPAGPGARARGSGGRRRHHPGAPDRPGRPRQEPGGHRPRDRRGAAGRPREGARAARGHRHPHPAPLPARRPGDGEEPRRPRRRVRHDRGGEGRRPRVAGSSRRRRCRRRWDCAVPGWPRRGCGRRSRWPSTPARPTTAPAARWTAPPPSSAWARRSGSWTRAPSACHPWSTSSRPSRRSSDIPHQFHVANRGGTDTGSLQLSGDGAIAGCVSIPTRYVHSSVEACHPDDIQASIDLVAASSSGPGSSVAARRIPKSLLSGSAQICSRRCVDSNRPNSLKTG